MTVGRLPAGLRVLVALVAVLALGVLAPLLTAGAQPPPGKTARIGYLAIRSGPSYLDEAFRHGLRELGYVEGQNISVEYRWADWKPDRLSTLAAELARLKVDVIVATGGIAAARAAKKTVTTIPVVFAVGDPVRAGLASLRSSSRFTLRSTVRTLTPVRFPPGRLRLAKKSTRHSRR